jgi:hypothetical protein
MFTRFLLRMAFCITIFWSLLFARTASKEFNKTIDLPSDGTVVVENVNGRISVESWERESVEVVAEIQVRDRSSRDAEELLDKVQIEVLKDMNTLTVKPKYPKHTGRGGLLDWIFSGGKPSVSVEIWLKIPMGAHLSASSVNGAVQSTNIGGGQNIRTTNGKIDIEGARGVVSASTTNGSIRAEITDERLEEDVDLKTVNGSIRAYLPTDVQADVHISTVNGSIHSDFPIEVSGDRHHKNIDGQINGGGASVDLKTVNGSVTLLEGED